MPALLHVALPLMIASAIPYLSTLAAKAGAFSREDNHETRRWQERLSGWRQRAHWAHLNALESFPIFAAAIVVAHLAAPVSSIGIAAAYGYCACRALYFFAFVADAARTRSAIWFASMGAVLALFLVALEVV